MPEEFLIILGAEAALLAFTAAMTLHAKRLGVLSGMRFERPAVSTAGNRRPTRPVRAQAWNVPRWARTWSRTLQEFGAASPGSPHRGLILIGGPRPSFRTRAQSLSSLVASSRRLDGPGLPRPGHLAHMQGAGPWPRASPECSCTTRAVAVSGEG